ncbi:MAG: efflux RND transporter periplasmic adaptor subunit [Candidatus Wallbacteria bacterium]|nr:efflux RND transporter periplasmic adaptor subunit [Candidatus Wallbacteria bacterium]
MLFLDRPKARRAAALLASMTLAAQGTFAHAQDGRPLVKTATVSRMTVESTIDLPGSLRPWQEIDLFARVSGYAREIRIDRGSRVKAGETLMVLEAPELSADTAAARARATEAEAEVAQRRAEAGLASITYDRLRAVRKETPEGVSLQTVEEAKARAEVARRAVELAEARASSAREGAKRARVMQDLTVLLAPFAGVITDRWIDPGAFVPAAGSSRSDGARLLHLADTSRLRLTLSVPESESRRVHLGTPARVTIDAVPGKKLETKVSRLSEVLQPGSRTLTAELDVENSDGTIPGGAFARVTLVLEVRENALVVPKEAVVSVAKKACLVLIESGKLQRRPAKLGANISGFVEVLGLENNDTLTPLAPDAILGLGASDSIPNGEAVQVEAVAPATPK